MKLIIIILGVALQFGCAMNSAIPGKTLNLSNLKKTPYGTMKLETAMKKGDDKVANGLAVKDQPVIKESNSPVVSAKRAFIEPLKGAQIQKSLSQEKSAESQSSHSGEQIIEISNTEASESKSVNILWGRMFAYYFLIATLAAIAWLIYGNAKNLSFKLENPFQKDENKKPDA